MNKWLLVGSGFICGVALSLMLPLLSQRGPLVVFTNTDYGLTDSEIDSLNDKFRYLSSRWQPVVVRSDEGLRVFYFIKNHFRNLPRELNDKVISQMKNTREGGNKTGAGQEIINPDP